MAESMKDFEKELEESMKKIEEGDILTGTVISVDEKEVILDLKYYAEGVIPVEDTAENRDSISKKKYMKEMKYLRQSYAKMTDTVISFFPEWKLLTFLHGTNWKN